MKRKLLMLNSILSTLLVLDSLSKLKASSNFYPCSIEYEANLNDTQSCPFRTESNDSFQRIPGVAPESRIFHSNEETFAPLTKQSLVTLNENNSKSSSSLSSNSSTPSLTGLLQIKRTSSRKSFSEINHENCLIPFDQKIELKSDNPCNNLFSAPQICEALTESNSTITNSMTSPSEIPEKWRNILEISRFTDSLLEYLEPNGLENLRLANKGIKEYLDNHVINSFNYEFPCLCGITKSFFRLISLKRYLNDPGINFKEWEAENSFHPNLDTKFNLYNFIDYRLATSDSANDRYKMVQFVEFCRAKLLQNYRTHIPRPLNIIFPSSMLSNSEIKSKLRSFIMKASQNGHVRILKALFDNIKYSFSSEIAGHYILDLFLLGTESQKGIPWTPLQRSALQRSVQSRSWTVANFLVSTVAEDEVVLKAYFNTHNYQQNISGFWEGLFCPLIWRQKIIKALKKEMFSASTHKQVSAVHLAISKSKDPHIVFLFLLWEREFLTVNREDTEVLYQLAFTSKSIEILKLVSRFFPLKVTMEVSFKSDWLEGFLFIFPANDEIKQYILKKKGILKLLAYHGSVSILKYLHENYFSTTEAEFLALVAQAEEDGKGLIEVAFEREKWEMVRLLMKLKVNCDRKLLRKFFDDNVEFLDDILLDQHARETFAYHYTWMNSHVTLLEWSIISKNMKSFKWVLENVSMGCWRKFDSAGHTPIHLAVISGNPEAIKLLLAFDGSLENILNSDGWTPLELAYKIRGKSTNQFELEISNQVIDILINK